MGLVAVAVMAAQKQDIGNLFLPGPATAFAGAGGQV